MTEEKERIIKEVLRLLGEKYPDGLYEYLYKHCPDLYGQLIELEDRIDQTYLDPHISVEQLKTVLRDYWMFHVTVMKEFKQVKQVDLNLSQVRGEMFEERSRT